MTENNQTAYTLELILKNINKDRSPSLQKYMKTKSDEDIPDSKQLTDLQDLLISLNFKAINFERFSAPFSPFLPKPAAI